MTTGHNTDVTGFAKAFREGLPDAATDDVVLLGAGGAGTAVAHALVRLGVRRLLVVDPDAERSETLVRTAGLLSQDADVGTLTADDLPDALTNASGLVNATPGGHGRPSRQPGLTRAAPAGLWLADIVYRPLDDRAPASGGHAGLPDAERSRAWPSTRPPTRSS